MPLVKSGVLAGKRVELLEGEIVQMSPEGIPHSYTQPLAFPQIAIALNRLLLY